MTQVKGTGIETDEKCENCGAPMVIKFGRFGEFMACSNYPECKTTKEMPKGDAAAANCRGRADHLRQVRKADAAQALAIRPVLRLHRLSRLQEHEGPPASQGRHLRGASAALRELRQGDGPQERSLRPLLLLFRLSRLQDHPQDRKERDTARSRPASSARPATKERWSSESRVAECSTPATGIRSASSP